MPDQNTGALQAADQGQDRRKVGWLDGEYVPLMDAVPPGVNVDDDLLTLVEKALNGAGGGGGTDDQRAVEVGYDPLFGLTTSLNAQGAIDEVAGSAAAAQASADAAGSVASANQIAIGNVLIAQGVQDTAIGDNADDIAALQAATSAAGFVSGATATVAGLTSVADRQLVTLTNTTASGFGIPTSAFHLSEDPNAVGSVGQAITLPVGVPVDLYLVGPSADGPGGDGVEHNGTVTGVHVEATWDGSDVTWTVVESVRHHPGPGDWAARSYGSVVAAQTEPLTLLDTDFDLLFDSVVGGVDPQTAVNTGDIATLQGLAAGNADGITALGTGQATQDVAIAAAQGSIATNTAAIAAIPAVIDEDDFVSDSDVRPPSQQSVRQYTDNAYGEVLAAGPSGGDDAPAVRAIFDKYLNQTKGRKVVLPNTTPLTGTTYVFETKLQLRKREQLVVPNGVTVEWRPAVGSESDPAIEIIRNQSSVVGNGTIQSFAPTPHGLVRFGPEGWVNTYDVGTTSGSPTVTGTFSPVPTVGATMAIKNDGIAHGFGTVVAASPTSVTLDLPAGATAPDGRLYVLEGTGANVLYGHVGEGLTLRGDDDATSVGVVFQSVPQGGTLGTFHNTVRDCTVRNFGKGVWFDAQGNGNAADGVSIVQVSGIAYHFENSEECSVDGGFIHNSNGVVCARVDRGKYNKVDTKAEPGGSSTTFIVEGGAEAERNRFLFMDNISGGFTDNGEQTTYILANRVHFGQDRMDYTPTPTAPSGPSGGLGAMYASDDGGGTVSYRVWNGTTWAQLQTGGGAEQIDRVTADITKVSDTDTSATSTDPLSVTGLEPGVYEVSALATYEADAGEDIKTNLAISGGGVTAEAIVGESPTESDTSPSSADRQIKVGANVNLAGGGVTGQVMATRYSGSFETTSANAVVELRWAQNTSGVVGTTLKAGSFLRVKRIS